MHVAALCSRIVSGCNSDRSRSGVPRRPIELRVAVLLAIGALALSSLVCRASTLSLFDPVADSNTGYVSLNGVDTAEPTTPFTFDWGDGTVESSWFPGEHTYADVCIDYAVTVTAHYEGGGTDSKQASIDFAQPGASAGPDQELTCAVTSVVLDGSASGGTAPLSYVWSPGGETTEDITVSTPGTYMLTVTGANGCSSSDSVVVTEDVVAPTASAGPDQELTCATTEVTLDGSASDGTAPYTYEWSPGGETTEDITVSTPGTYTLTVTGGRTDARPATRWW